MLFLFGGQFVTEVPELLVHLLVLLVPLTVVACLKIALLLLPSVRGISVPLLQFSDRLILLIDFAVMPLILSV